MNDVKARLARGAAVLDELQQRREVADTPQWGYSIEWLIVQQELHQLQQDILRDPGALESQLVRVRRKREGR